MLLAGGGGGDGRVGGENPTHLLTRSVRSNVFCVKVKEKDKESITIFFS